MRYIILFALLALFVFLAYWRLRPYIRGLRRLLGVLREVNRVRAAAAAAQSDLPRRPVRETAADKSLVRCAACGTWAPASRAVSLRAGATYCSHACLERAADPSRNVRKSAS